MLKPAEPAEPPSNERPVGELVHQLVEDGKAYANAEIALAKAVATAKGKALVVPAALFGIAFILSLASITALALGVVLALTKFVGPLLAGILGLLLFAGLAGGCGWYGAQRVRRVL